jgi:hypothetical protein
MTDTATGNDKKADENSTPAISALEQFRLDEAARLMSMRMGDDYVNAMIRRSRA